MHPSDAVIHYIMDNLSAHFHEDFCNTVAELSNVPYSHLRTGVERRQWLQSPHKRIVVHFVPFHASWLNMVEIWFGILKGKCLKYEHFFSVDQLCESIMAFIETWNEFYAHPFRWSYTGEGLHRKAVRRFCHLLFIQTDQMDCRFLEKQLLLMSNISENYLSLIPQDDWDRLINLAAKKEDFIQGIIESEARPKVQKRAYDAYGRFIDTVLHHKEPMDLAA
jgi:transposase